MGYSARPQATPLMRGHWARAMCIRTRPPAAGQLCTAVPHCKAANLMGECSTKLHLRIHIKPSTASAAACCSHCCSARLTLKLLSCCDISSNAVDSAARRLRW